MMPLLPSATNNAIRLNVAECADSGKRLRLRAIQRFDHFTIGVLQGQR